ncbi:MAG: penicillin-binding transpeptidase domain-containing protein [Lachnospiraceae bacterium]|nr:penicillin-binding transpeptidase domain-containing protein [Lachnospiraceae bacterium]
MKKYIFILIMLLSVIISGCSSNSQSQKDSGNGAKQQAEIENQNAQNTNNVGEKEASAASEIIVDYSKYFQEINGCAILYHEPSKTYSFYNRESCETEVSPLSTFKIISALAGLENRVLDNENSKMEYSGADYPVDTWNADLTLKEAFENSCVWYFRQVIDKVGQENMRAILQELQYGNCDLSEWDGSGVNPLPELNGFWLASSLNISPTEQITVLRTILGTDSPFDAEHIETLKNIMYLTELDNGRLYGKTGSSSDGKAWFVGFLEESGDRTYFAVYLDDMQNKDIISGNKAKEIAVNILQSGPKTAAEITQAKKYPVSTNEYQTKFQDYSNTYEIKDGYLYGSGQNTSGQLGIGEISSTDFNAQDILIADNIIHMDACGETLVYLNVNHELYGVGNNGSGQLGQPIEKQDKRTDIAYDAYHQCCITKPVLIMDHVKYAAVGGGYIMILSEDGTLYTMGDNLNGQLGNGTARPVVNAFYTKKEHHYSSEPVPLMDDIAFIAADHVTAAAISKKGDLWVWGDNSFGEIGNIRRGNGMPSVSTDVVSEPYLVLKKIKSVRFEDNTVYAVDFQDQEYCWGKNATAYPKPVEAE